MTVTVIADPGACWKADTQDESWLRMRDLLDITADAGAQVFKIQMLRAGMYRDGTAAAKLVSDYEVPAEWLPKLHGLCEDRGLELMATAYRAEDVAVVDPYVKRHKVASFDALNPYLRKAIKATGKPVIVSTGLLDYNQVLKLRWVDWIDCDATFLHCVSAYPAPPEAQNLSVILCNNHDTEGYDNVTRWSDDRMGFSDHTRGYLAAVMAVAYGATVIEKHIRVWSTPETNPDYPAAASPQEFREYVTAIREAESMVGDRWKVRQSVEWAHYAYNGRTRRRGGD